MQQNPTNQTHIPQKFHHPKPIKNLTIIKGIKTDNEIVIKGNEKIKENCVMHTNKITSQEN